MFIRTSGALKEGFFLSSLGHSCHYLLSVSNSQDGSRPFVLIDPGTSAHLPALKERINSFGLRIQDLGCIFLTHLHPERMSSIPYLKKEFPQLVVYGSVHMQRALQTADRKQAFYDRDCSWRTHFHHPRENLLSEAEYFSLLNVDRVVADSETLDIDHSLSLRVISTPGHTSESLAFLVQPYHYLIVDEGFGYFRGRQLIAPGADWNLQRALESIAKVSRLELSGLCLPYYGTMVGSLVRKHLQSITQNSEDLRSEVRRALGEGLSPDQVKAIVLNSFYTSDSPDPILRYCLEQSFEAIWQQVATTN